VIGLSVIACSSSPSPGQPSDAATISDASGGEGGPDATFTCTDRTRPECQPIPIGPTGTSGVSLAILGRDVYWFQQDTSVTPYKETVLRTSLDTGTTKDETGSGSGLTSDGSYVFMVNPTCCTSVDNLLFKLDPSLDKWTQADLAFPQMPDYNQTVAFGGTVTISMGGYTLLEQSAADLTRTGTWQTMTDTIWMIGTDGAQVFAELGANKQYRISRIEAGNKATDLVPVPAAAPVGWLGTFVADDTSVYFPSATSLLRASKSTASTKADLLVDLSPNHPISITVDATFLYWLDEAGLHSIAKTGGTPTLLATVTNGAMVQQTNDDIVWTSGSGLFKLHK
jgi:hypothetical protein